MRRTKYTKEYVYQLILEKLLGEISREDDIELERIMQHDVHAYICWLDMKDAQTATNGEFLDDARAELTWCRITDKLSKIPVEEEPVLLPLPSSRWRWAVAAMLLICTGTAYFLYLSTKTHLPIIPGISMNNQSVTPSVQPGTTVQGHFTPVSPPNFTDTGKTIITHLDSSAILAAQLKQDSIDDVNTEWNTLTVPAKVDYKFDLSDGTEVHLNAASTLRFPFIFPGKTREVYLEGEAYFTVAHNPKQPFIVHTNTTSIRALGTAFNVNSYDADQTTTSLVQGSVVTDVGDSLDVVLKPGYQAIYKAGERFKIKRFDEEMTLSWRNGIYAFKNKTLKELAPVMERWYGMKMIIDATPLLTQTFTGSIEREKPLDIFLRSLRETTTLDYYILGSTIHFKIKEVVSEVADMYD
ncbi:FecR domain-containing protein [Chitinophaga pendula]|uniref:FecR family protein n=1 Tax=Chitinophaga TaxID=79328 RepID=UPI000BAF143E|nr:MULTISPECIES: FecR domain-containing protein [Chitinophaga]ASZ11696.1 hypothetical protein CK934_12360 [Chitinophaga sp. MD30]UCJ05288.1 FecR domain-containing protein [Chitinophaga pendula]